MDNVTTKSIDIQDPDVQRLYRKGLETYLDDTKSKPCVYERRAITEHGATLAYDKLSEKEAAVLRQLLRSGPPVKELRLHDISLGAFKLAFDDLEKCPSPSDVHVHVNLKGKELDTKLWRIFRGLHSLELSCDNSGSGFANQIARYMRQNKNLRELRLRNSCGGDKGAALLIEALVENNTLKILELYDIKLPSDSLIGFVKMLAINSTLEVVRLGDTCRVEADKVWSLLAQERYADVFQRLQIVWTYELLSVLTELIRREACSFELSVRVTSSVDEEVLREFFDVVAENKTLNRLHLDSEVFDALANGIASLVKRTRTLREILSATR